MYTYLDAILFHIWIKVNVSLSYENLIIGKDAITCLFIKPTTKNKKTAKVIPLSNLKTNSLSYKTPFAKHEMLVLPVAAKIRETSVTNPLS